MKLKMSSEGWEEEDEIPLYQLKEQLETEKASKEVELPIKLQLRGAVGTKAPQIKEIRRLIRYMEKSLKGGLDCDYQC